MAVESFSRTRVASARDAGMANGATPDPRRTLTLPLRALGLTSRAELKAPAGRWALAPLLAVGLYGLIALTEPATAETGSSAALSVLEWLGVLALLYLLVAPALAPAAGRATLALGLAATLYFLLFAFTCPLTAHHAWGAWVALSWAAAGAAVALQAVALARSRPRPE